MCGIYKSTLSKIVRKFCRAVRNHLRPTFVQTPSGLQFRILASRFNQLYDTPYIIGTISGLQNYVLSPVVGTEDFYCRKYFIQQFYRELLDRIVYNLDLIN